MFDIQSYYESFRIGMEITVGFLILTIILLILFFAFKFYNTIKKYPQLKGYLLVYLFLVVTFVTYTIPRYINIKKDIADGSIPIETTGTFDYGGRNSYKIDGTNYYVSKNAPNMADYEGKTVKYSYYYHSKCIYSIEPYDEEEDNEE